MEKEKYNPRVTIVIPVYNGEKYVSLAIDSALRQTYKNIEIIVVNDGSSDSTDRICKSYGNKIKYLKKENGGVSTALNLAIQNMNGEYFSWLSHDDLYYSEKIEEEIKYINDNNLMNTKTIIYSNCSYNDQNGYYLGKTIHESNLLNKDSAYSLLNGAINGLTLLIPKKAFQEAGVFDTKLRCTQDYDMWFRMYKKGYKFVHIPNILTVTRIHKESVTNTSPKYLKEVKEFWIDLIEYFSDKDKERLYGSVYNYYYNIYNSIDKEYTDVINYCEEKLKRFEKNIDKVKLSVVIYFNSDEYLIQTINSIINQTHKNIEIILINNGYKNDIKELEKIVKDNKITYIVNKNELDLDKVLNDATKKTSGDYISYVKAGTIWEKEKAKLTLTKMNKTEDVISHSSYIAYNNNSESLVNSGYYNGYVFEPMTDDFQIDLSTVIVDKNFIEKNKIQFKDKKDIKDNKILGINKPLATVYNKEYKKVGKDYLKEKVYNNESIIERHKKELARYEYMQTKEWKRVKKIKNTFRTITFRKKIQENELNNDQIINNKVSKCYKKISNIKRKIKK